ncbi:hypothetical protein [Actinophytocola sediminis]
MTDLLGLLTGLHAAITHLGELHISISDIEGGLPGLVDHETLTIHLRPGLDLATGLAILASGVAALAPAEPSTPGQVAVGGETAGTVMPPDRHLRVVH